MILPIELQKDINGYLFYALPLCILKAYPDHIPWIMENYIDCYSFDLPSFMYVDAPTYHTNLNIDEVLEFSNLSYDVLDCNLDINNLIKQSLDSNHYIVIYIDEYYAPGRPNYLMQHLLHEILIYGYDENNYHYLAFDKSNKFITKLLPMEYINQSYWEGRKIALALEYSHSLIFIKKMDLHEYKFSIDRFIIKLHNYLDSKTGCANYLIIKSPGETFYYGISTTLMIEKYLHSEKVNYSNFYTAIHTWYEHKVGLLQRFIYVYENGYKNSFNNILNVINKYKLLVEEANNIRMLALKLFISKNIILKNKIIDKSLYYYEREFELLQKFV